MEAKMADIRDEHGNPIELTDEHGNPVVLTDEHGNPMRLTGVATKIGPTLGLLMRGGGEDGPSGGHGDAEQGLLTHEEHDDGGSGGHVRSTTSGSSSFDENEPSERREKKSQKKKGLTQKIKEKLTGRRHKEEQPQTTTATKTASRTAMDRPTAVEETSEKMVGSGHGHHTDQ